MLRRPKYTNKASGPGEKVNIRQIGRPQRGRWTYLRPDGYRLPMNRNAVGVCLEWQIRDFLPNTSTSIDLSTVCSYNEYCPIIGCRHAFGLAIGRPKGWPVQN